MFGSFRQVLVLGLGLAAVSACALDDGDVVEDVVAEQIAVIVIGPVDSSSGATEVGSGIVSVRDKQGVALLGSVDPQLDTARARLTSAFWLFGAGAPFDGPVTVDAAGLAVYSGGIRLAPEQLVGLAFVGDAAGGETIYYYISSYFGPDVRGRARHAVQAYRFSYDTWKPLCAGDELAYAYALPGYFGSSGAYADDAEHAVFACRVSAAAKSVRWGYGPLDAGREFFQASTRMARADYCGNGQSSTLPETPILVYDLFGLVSGFIPDDLAVPSEGIVEEPPFGFEAGWSKDGQRGAVCLSKRRWQAMPMNGPCSWNLPDPRQANSGGRYCDEIGQPPGTPIPTAHEFLARVAAIGGVTFNDSQVNDLGLWTWKKASATRTEHLTTSQGFWDERGGTQAPRPGYVARPTWLGAVFTQSRPGTAALYVYYNPLFGDYRTTTASLSFPWARKELVGFIYVTAPTDGSAYGTLLRYYSTTHRDSLLLRAGTPAPAGYSPAGIEGYTFR